MVLLWRISVAENYEPRFAYAIRQRTLNFELEEASGVFRWRPVFVFGC